MKFSLTLLASIWTCFAPALGADLPVGVTPPNVVLIVADDLGYGELGCYGGTEIPTPNLDALANGGLRFTNGYVTAPFCAASRAALMTGRYQTRFGFEFNPIGAQNMQPGVGLPVAELTLADRLRNAGYATSLVGKWHLGGTADYHPQRRGFDEFFGFMHEGHYFVPLPWKGVTTWLRRKSLPGGGQGRWASDDGRVVWSTHMGHNEPPYDADNPVMRSSQPVQENENLTDAFTREAVNFIGRHQSQPFFLCLTYNAVHSPLQGKHETMQKLAHIEDIQRRIFAAMLSDLDDGVGRVLQALQEHGLESNTLVVFLSDNGGPTKELTSSNAPLRGGKGNLYEGGIRIPFIVSWKEHLTPGVSDVPVTSLDIASTAMIVAGIEAGDSQLDGENLLTRGEATAATTPRSLFWRVGSKQAIRSGDWKLVRMRDDWELYHLADDIGETRDQSASQPERVRELAAQWEAWNAKQAAPLWK